MVKAQREGEPSAQRAAFEARGLTMAGAIEPPGTLEGGDLRRAELVRCFARDV